ncbi:MAG: hypothetical protein ACODTL_03420 [Brucella sp.]
MVENNIANDPSPNERRDISDWAKTVTKQIRGVIEILGALGALIVAINAIAPNLLLPGSWLGSSLQNVVELLFDRPALERQRASTPSTRIPGYAYFETGSDGSLTSSGRLQLLNNQIVTISGLRDGDVLKAIDGVNVRATATGSSQLLATMRAGDCFRVSGPATNISSDGFGGWVPGNTTQCK